MIEQLEQLKINADNINSVLSKKRGALRSIKLERTSLSSLKPYLDLK